MRDGSSSAVSAIQSPSLGIASVMIMDPPLYLKNKGEHNGERGEGGDDRLYII